MKLIPCFLICFFNLVENTSILYSSPICLSWSDLYCFSYNVQGSHGFVKTHKWSNTVGAFVNIEASGTGGFGTTVLLVDSCFYFD